jgi:hypothetical protein
MATTHAPAPDLLTLANLHAALDRMVEIEALFTNIHLPLSRSTSARRVHLLATELRTLLVDLLRPDPR